MQYSGGACTPNHKALEAVTIVGSTMMIPIEDEEAQVQNDVDQKIIAKEYAPKEYVESKSFQCCARFCGRCCFLFLAFCVIAWITHLIVLTGSDPCFLEVLDAQKNDRVVECSDADIAAGEQHWELAPEFSKSLIWMSISHHTDVWREHWQRSAPPPPPNF